MAILHSCCCWRSVRKGSFACGIHTAFYYTINTIHSSVVLNSELNFILYNSSTNMKTQDSFLNPDTTSTTSIIFTFLILIVTASGILTSMLLLYGLHKDCKLLLLPWIINLVVFTLLDLLYIFYNLFEHALKWNPFVSILITLDLFITCLHLYALLCVISQYQELKAGRGRALDDQNMRIPNILYSNHPTATSYLSSSRRPMTTTCGDLRPTPTQSPTGTAPPTSFLTSGGDEISPNSIKTRKSVKFDRSNNSNKNGTQLLEPWTVDVKTPLSQKISGGSDTAPLIESSNTIDSTDPGGINSSL